MQTGGLWEYLWYTHTHTDRLSYAALYTFILYYIGFSVFVRLQFEMLTGTLPFQGKDRNETMNMILK